MSSSLRLATVAVLLQLSGVASANQPPWSEERTERYERWSWAPLVSALVATEFDDPFSLLGAQLRLRYGTAQNALDEPAPPTLFAFGLSLQTAHLDTIEPSLVIGVHRMPDRCDCWFDPVWLDLRLDVGAGYAFSDGRDVAFLSAKLGLGAMFARQVDYTYERYPTQRYTKQQFRAQFDLIVEAQLAQDGEWRLGFGIELDPLRFLPDLYATLTQ